MKPRRRDLAYVDAVQNEDAELLLSGRPNLVSVVHVL